MWKLVLGGVAAFFGYEAWKKYQLQKGPAGGFQMTPGHLYNLTLNFTGAGSSAGGVNVISNATAQAALNSQAPGMFDVISSAEVDNTKTLTVGAVYSGASAQSYTPAHFTSGWPTAYGTLTVATVQDMGGAPQTAPAA